MSATDNSGAQQRRSPKPLAADALRRQYAVMAIARSKLVSRRQVAVPVAGRRKPRVGSGSVRKRNTERDRVVGRDARRYTSEDVHRALFPNAAKRRTLRELKEGLRRHIRARQGARQRI